MTSIWIDNAERLEEFCAGIEEEGFLAVDTESDHYHAYNAQVCLIQIATSKESALIDPLAIDEEGLTPFFEMLQDQDVVKILHAARNDIIEIDRDYGAEINNLFDTRVAARFLGYEKNSLSWLLEELMDIQPGGNLQRFDWTTRPLPERALRYAAEDVLYLADLRDRFNDELRESSWWDPFTEYCDHVTRTARHEPKEFDPEDWRGFKKSNKLDNLGQTTLRELFIWRHEECERINRAAFMVLSKRAMVQIAKEKPGTRKELRNVRGLPKSIDSDQLEGILKAVQSARNGEIPPKPVPRSSYSPRPSDEESRFRALRKWRNKKAGQTDLPGEFIATNATLSEIAADPPKSVEDLSRFSEILGWHRDLFGKEIVEILAAAKAMS